jgi:hypothetical protein
LWGAVLALFALAAGGLVLYLGAYGPRGPDAAEERAVRAVQRLGGEVVRAEAAPSGPVVEVVLSGSDVNDAGLRELAGLKHLRALRLEGTPVSGTGLSHLADLEELERLHLGGTRVGDAGLKGLAGLKRLRVLDLRGTRVTGAGLKELAGLQQLQELDLTDSRVTGPGLSALAGLKQLRTLSVTETPRWEWPPGVPHSYVPGWSPAYVPEVFCLKQLKTLVVKGHRAVLEEVTRKCGPQAGLGPRLFAIWRQQNMPGCQIVWR